MTLQPVDPVFDFAHDHVHLSRLVTELREIVDAVRRGARGLDEVHADVLARVDDLREDLLLHFAREEEGLFPYLVSEFPDLREAIAATEAAHDGVCGALARMTYLAQRGPQPLGEHPDALLNLFARFDAAYGSHARDEVSLLRGLGPRLDDRQRRELAEIVRAL